MENIVMGSKNAPPLKDKKLILIIFAWTAILFVSDLPDILWNELSGQAPGWLLAGKIGLLAAFFGLCFIWKSVRPLWQYALVLLVLFLALAASKWVGNTAWWQSFFGGPQVSFTTGFVGVFIRDLGVAAAVILVLWGMKRRHREFFLTAGQLNAPLEPVRWLGIRKGASWRTMGWIFAGAAGLGVLIPTWLAVRPSPDTLLRAAPLLPSVLLFAAVNAFTEEMYFRASLLSTLHQVIGRSHALLINVVFFGLAHYLYGSPPGVPGFLMTGFLAWFLGKSMLETKGVLWPWFIHFVPDVIIFTFYAVAWVQR